MSVPDVTGAAWHKSSYSGNNGTCVEVARLPDGRIAVRDSNYPEAAVLFFSRPGMSAWLEGVKAGKFDTRV